MCLEMRGAVLRTKIYPCTAACLMLTYMPSLVQHLDHTVFTWRRAVEMQVARRLLTVILPMANLMPL